jgi:uncharacterized SAM-binding protein YcdF (DUF218 family)
LKRCYIIMGAKVLSGGRPSGSLARRIRAALELAGSDPAARFLATGGLGENPPAEARVVCDALVAHGIDASRILIEDRATDTLSSVLYCKPILDRLDDLEELVVCSDRFHVWRCALLFRIMGLSVRPAWIESGRPAFGLVGWIYYWVRDLIALVWDAPQACWHRAGLRRKSAG